MKSLLPWLAFAGAAMILCACAALPSKGDIADAVAAPAVDAAAVQLENAVAVLAVSVEAAMRQPDAGVDRVKLAKGLRRAADRLDEARSLFDARTGDPAALVNAGFDALSEAVPVTASAKVRFALALFRGATAAYASGLTLTGPPPPPSEALKAARQRADAAIDALLASLPPPGS